MSSDECAGDAEDLEHTTFAILWAAASFDGRDRVMSFAAWELQYQATAYSAVYGHPGFVPDEYLADLGTETTITAAELCAAGMWERAAGGYRVLDSEAVQVCVDRVRELREEDERKRTRERERQARMARPIVAATPCAVCGTPYQRIELIAPGGLPSQWNDWDPSRQDMFLRLYRQPDRWHLLIDRPDDNDYDLGQPIDAAWAGQIMAAFEPPLSYDRVHTAGFYDDAGFCDRCDAPYCHRHWNVSSSGLGTCPGGHDKSLDPHRRPEWS